MSRLRMPRFVTDVARDLRDRRLLVPALALLVALVAVPVLLAKQAEPAPPPPAPQRAAADATAVESAVITEPVGIRNYQKRLAALKRKNPFRQQFALPTEASVSIEGGEGDDDSAPTSGAGSTAGATEGTASGGAPTTTGDGTTITETTQVDTTEVDSTVSETVEESEPAEPPKPQVRFYAGRIDVVVGPLGDTKELEDVRYLDFLPSDKTPVVSFINLKGTGDAAVFAVSRDVLETSGEGTCAPKERDGCQFLTLKVGEERTLKHADGTTYRLKLLDATVVRVPDPRNH